MAQSILYETPAPGIARIVLNRPETRNAQDTRLLYELNDAYDRATQDESIKVIITAANMLSQLENKALTPPSKPSKSKPAVSQYAYEALIAHVKKLDPNEITPKEALQALFDIKSMCEEG